MIESLSADPAAPADRVALRLSEATKELLWSALESGTGQDNADRVAIAQECLIKLCGNRNEATADFDPPLGFRTADTAAYNILHVLGSLASRTGEAQDVSERMRYNQKYPPGIKSNGALKRGLEHNRVSEQTCADTIVEIEWACSAAGISLSGRRTSPTGAPAPKETSTSVIITLKPETNKLLHDAMAAALKLSPREPATRIMGENIDRLCGPCLGEGQYGQPLGVIAKNPAISIGRVLGSLAAELGTGRVAEPGKADPVPAQYRTRYPRYNNSFRKGLAAIKAPHDAILQAIADIEEKCAAASIELSGTAVARY